MVRKQLYIDDAQERQLKARSEELGISEAEIVRRLLDRGLFETATTTPRSPSERHIDAFIARARDIARATQVLPYKRDDLYADRGAPGRR